MENSFNINKGDIVSFTGSGGKTSLIFYLANKLKKNGSVLIATTTKIFQPEIKENNSFIFIYPEEIDTLSPQDNFIHIFCSEVKNHKICNTKFEDLDKLKNKFDYILIEADGSSNKPLKGWREDEPIIYPYTTKTIAIVDITALDKEKNEENIHRFDIFQKQYHNFNKFIEKNDYIEYINSNNFFRNSLKETILFFNKIENFKIFSALFDIVANLSFPNKIIFGSVHKEKFFIYKKVTPIVLASGFSRRFSTDKLSFKLKNKRSILEETLFNISQLNFNEKILIGKNNIHENLCNKYEFKYIYNNNPKLGQSFSVILGTLNASLQGYLFIPGDMPFLTRNTILKIIYYYQLYDKIIVPFVNGQKRAPVLFPKKYYKNLICLTGDSGGSEILKKEKFIKCNFKNRIEFFDIDTPEDLKKLELLEE